MVNLNKLVKMVLQCGIEQKQRTIYPENLKGKNLYTTISA